MPTDDEKKEEKKSTLQIKNQYFEDERSGTTTDADATEIGQFLIFKKYCIDTSSLFIGKFKRDANRAIPVIIRRYETDKLDDIKIKRELDALRSPMNNHENFIQYFDHTPADTAFTYYAVELCRFSVEDLIITTKMTESEYKEVAVVLKTLTREKIMQQTTLGLDYLHGLEGGFIHRNIHGRNVLVAEIPTSSDTHYVVKLSDFRFGKSIIKEGNQQSNTRSPFCWSAPEIENVGKVSPKTDVFILGCFFYYVLSGGHHPFGCNTDYPSRNFNIRNNKPKWNQHAAKDNYKNLTDEAPKKLITMVENYLELMKRMTSSDASDRPTTSQILRHFDTKEYFPIYSDTVRSKSSTATRPGLCVIFHQDQFDNPKHNLPGYRKDVKSLINTFWLFGYDLRIYADLTGKELLQTVKNVAMEKEANNRDSIFKGYASMVVCILSHGGPGTVEGVDLESVNVSDLQWAFSRENCPDLQDKPKIFFIQACQGNKKQNLKHSLVEVKSIYDKQQEAAHKTVAEAAAMPIKNIAMTKAQFSDVVTMWATIVDYESYVYPDSGSSFIQSLCYHLVVSQGGTSGDRMRDLHDAHLAITQEVSSQPIWANQSDPVWILNPRDNTYRQYYINEYVNQTPLYMSTACGKKVGFKVVPENDRCKQIHYYGRFCGFVHGDDDALFKYYFAHGTDTLGALKLDENYKLDLIWHLLPPPPPPILLIDLHSA